MSSTGLPPADVAAARVAIKAANNDRMIIDPRQTASGTEGSGACLLNASATTNTSKCAYYYQTCNSATGYRILTRFESTSDQSLYNVKVPGTNEVCTGGTDCLYY